MPPQTEQQLEQDIAEAEARRRGQLTQSISNPGGRPLTETPADDPGTRRISTPSFTLIGSRTIEREEESSPNTPKPPDSDTLNISTNYLEELDPFQ
uniref:Uncharacterized protein n=1 Tax=Moniliophthora roreri TaxID=221103 RepID=A0A0W0FBQ3_MONRR